MTVNLGCDSTGTQPCHQNTRGAATGQAADLRHARLEHKQPKARPWSRLRPFAGVETRLWGSRLHWACKRTLPGKEGCIVAHFEQKAVEV